MRTLLFVVSLAACVAAPAFAQLGPAGVPGAPGLVPTPAPAPAQTEPTKPSADPKTPAACAQAKDVERCKARQEARAKARAACKGKSGDTFKQCVSDYLKRKK